MNYVPAAVPDAEPDSRCRGRDVPEPGRLESIRGVDAGFAGRNGATIARRRLLYQHPQFEASGICTGNGTFCTETDNGSNVYHGMIFRADKRFTHGFMLMSSYTWSRMRETVTPLNPWEEPEERVAAVDRPHRITFASVAELPVGRDRRWGSDWSPVVDAVLGGWQFSAKYEWQVGQPLVFNGNTYFDPACGDPKRPARPSGARTAAASSAASTCR